VGPGVLWGCAWVYGLFSYCVLFFHDAMLSSLPHHAAAGVRTGGGAGIIANREVCLCRDLIYRSITYTTLVYINSAGEILNISFDLGIRLCLSCQSILFPFLYTSHPPAFPEIVSIRYPTCLVHHSRWAYSTAAVLRLCYISCCKGGIAVQSKLYGAYSTTSVHDI
jgi:hypothetical protein